MQFRRSLLFVATGGAMLLTAYSAAAASRTYMVVIDKMKFGPVPGELHKGDAIVWVNRDFLRHSATAGDKSFDVDLTAGAKAKTVLTKRGTVTFMCRYHPGMRGVLQVR